MVVLLCAGALFCLALVYLLSAGILSQITVRVGSAPLKGKLTIAYKFRKGPYRNCCEVFSEAEQLAPGCRKVGIFYDDPKAVVSNNLRWAAAVILSAGEEVFVDDNIRELLDRREFKTAELPYCHKAIVTEFPFNSRLSILIAVKRVYPKIAEFTKETTLAGWPHLEFYGLDKLMPLIRYMVPLENNEAFMVASD